MKILFVMRHALYCRNYESAIRELAGRGHRIDIAVTPLPKAVDESLARALAREYPGVTFHRLPARRGRFLVLADAARRLRDFLRFTEPCYSDTPKLRERAGAALPHWLRRLLSLRGVSAPVVVRLLRRILIGIERVISPEATSSEYLMRTQPDLVLLTPLVDMTYEQLEYLKSARALGIPTVHCVASWDNLTNKGLIQLIPSRVLVWNEIQKREAVEMNRVPADRVVCTGAQLFDQWFEARPSRDAAAFRSRAGLPPDRPYVLYVCSSVFVAREEAGFVREWVEQIRKSPDPALRGLGILIRPYPARAREWREAGFEDLEGVSVWPPSGAQQIDPRSKQDYFDSLYHSLAVVGINTSAFIEAGIVRRPVLTILDPSFRETQTGTLHFHYLVEHGLLKTAESFPEHLRQLGAAARGEFDARSVDRFLELFVRPHGLDVPATPIFVESVEEAGSIREPETGRPPFWALPARWLLLLPALAASLLRWRRERARVALGRRLYRLAVRLLQLAHLKEPVWRRLPPRLLALSEGRSLEGMGFVEPGETILRASRASARRRGTVVVGPWISEVGFEILYWAPFVRWAVEKHRIRPDRLLVVSRGGTLPWYGALGSRARYLDLFDLMTPEEFRERNQRRWAEEGGQKHNSLGAFDLEILERVKQETGEEDPGLLHPSLMYGLFPSFWRGRMGAGMVRKYTRYERLAPIPCESLGMELPEDYVAVRFYFRPSFPDSPENRAVVRRILTQITRTMDVVLLNPGTVFDEHADFDPAISARVHRLDRMDPSRNLEIQTGIISRARLFVGTYGGLSYLPPFYGIPSVALYSDASLFLPAHLDLAGRVFRELGEVFVPLEARSVDLLSRVLGPLEEEGGTRSGEAPIP